MKKKRRIWKIFYFIISLVTISAVVFSLYYVSLPEKYTFSIGDASPYDINAVRTVNDMQETLIRANDAAAQVEDVMIRNESVKENSLNSIDVYFSQAEKIREKYHSIEETESEQNDETPQTQDATEEEHTPYTLEDASLDFQMKINELLGVMISSNESEDIILLEETAFESFYGHAVSLTELILSRPVTRNILNSLITEKIGEVEDRMEFHSEDIHVLENILRTFLRPNLQHDREATESLRTLAFDTVMANPVTIPKGTRIVNFGETITPEKYELLKEMDLIETDEFDYRYLGGIILLVLIVIGIIYVYFTKYEKNNIVTLRDKSCVLLAFIIPFSLSLILVNFSVLALPVYICAVLITSYFGFRSGIFWSLLLITLLLPVTGFDVKFVIVSTVGCIVAALYTQGISGKNNYALIIISTAMACFTMSLTFDVLSKTGLRESFTDSVFAVLTGAVSVILALGLMPLFEMIFNSVSPLRLIELSQPGNTLLRRMFIEAPGTTQHSFMVGNLAQAGAQAIGANSLLARVGAYYHDIGKLEGPEMFSENQEGENPHDNFSPEESSAIILSHPDSGLRIAKKYNLPDIICKMIYEHHGNSRQIYFLKKAQDYAKENNLPDPDPEKYTYKTTRPSFKESAILMLADTAEAAIKSSGMTDLNEIERFIRKLVKQKIAEDQLVDSGLSFRDVEELIKAFLNIYSGHFRTRVRYPDDPSSEK